MLGYHPVNQLTGGDFHLSRDKKTACGFAGNPAKPQAASRPVGEWASGRVGCYSAMRAVTIWIMLWKLTY
jgi:hypothetical protein